MLQFSKQDIDSKNDVKMNRMNDEIKGKEVREKVKDLEMELSLITTRKKKLEEQNNTLKVKEQDWKQSETKYEEQIKRLKEVTQNKEL